MTQWLKQSTAATVKMGPFVDSGDGTTAETSLTIQKADVRLSKNGGNYAAASADQGASDVGATHDELGDYDISLDTTDTNTLGALRVLIKESGALVVWRDFMVAPANVWDSLFGADNLQVDIVADSVALASAADLAAMQTDVDAILVDTGTDIPAMLATIAAFLDTEIAAILADTNELQTDWVNGGRLDLLIDAIKAKTDLIPGTQDGKTFAQHVILQSSVLFGKISGAGTVTEVFRDIADAKDRVTVTVDASGNRTATVLDAT